MKRETAKIIVTISSTNEDHGCRLRQRKGLGSGNVFEVIEEFAYLGILVTRNNGTLY